MENQDPSISQEVNEVEVQRYLSFLDSYGDRIFFELGDSEDSHLVKELPRNIHHYIRKLPKNILLTDVKELESNEVKLKQNPDSFLSFGYRHHLNGDNLFHELDIDYHPTGLQKLLDEIEAQNDR